MKRFFLYLIAATLIFTQSCNDKDDVAVTGVSLNKNEMSLQKDATEKLIATVLPDDAANKAVTWSTADPTIAAIDQLGEVTGWKEGTTTITVTTKDGNFTATCEVTVYVPEEEISVTGVTLSIDAQSLPTGASVNISASVEPGNASNQNVTWSSSNTGFVTVENGKLTAVGKGTATVTVTTEDGNFTATCTVTVLDSAVDLLTGGSSRHWTWNEEIGDNKWHGMGGAVDNDASWWATGAGWSVMGEFTGATMTFNKTGLTLVKNRSNGTEDDGLFSVDLATRNPVWGRSMGKLKTENVTILNAKNTCEGESGDIMYEFDIIKLTNTELTLARLAINPDEDGEGNNPDAHGWGQATWWVFKVTDEPAGGAEPDPDEVEMPEEYLAMLCGSSSKAWTFDYDSPPAGIGPWSMGGNTDGPAQAGGWWNPLANGHNFEDGTMTFSRAGFTLVKETDAGSKSEGTFAYKNVKFNQGNYVSSGQLITKGVIVLDGGNPFEESKTGQYDILRMTQTEMVLAIWDQSGEEEWPGAWFWFFKVAD